MKEDPGAPEYQVAVVGLGYVGIPLAVGFAEAGCRTLGYDRDEEKIASLSRGESPIPTISPERIRSLLRKDLLRFTEKASGLAGSEAIVICVPTPLRTHLDPDIGFILDAGREIAPFLKPGMLVSLESSTYPGTTAQDLRRVLEEGSGLRAGVDFALAFSPEREDPGNAKSILREIPKGHRGTHAGMPAQGGRTLLASRQESRAGQQLRHRGGGETRRKTSSASSTLPLSTNSSGSSRRWGSTSGR